MQEMDYRKEYQSWLGSSLLTEGEQEELRSIAQDDRELKERFSRHLAFGTGGLRGIIGAGTNRMNKYVVQRASEGLAQYITEQGAAERGVAIAYDCRHFSDVFALESALVFAANGIKAYLFESLRPTPALSFAVRHLGAVAGVNVTASHNPPKYNGFKVYWEDGGQLPPHVSDVVLARIGRIPVFSAKTMTKEEALQKGLLEYIGREVDEAFLAAVQTQRVRPEAPAAAGAGFGLVYTPLHGSGNKPVRAILKRTGFQNVVIVPEQELPDGAFPTVESPNPENMECFDMAVELAKKERLSLIIGTDPDADRVGIVVRKNDGKYVTMSGNQVGAMLTDYILRGRAERGALPANGAVVSTIVSTKMAASICKHYNVAYFETLTGFKFIGEKILEFEEANSYEYLFGFEESYGYLAGTHARDKDAVVASMLIAEMAAYYSLQGKTLYDVMEELYGIYGGFAEETISITMEGLDGLAKIAALMDGLRREKPSSIGPFDVLAIRDYDASVRFDLVTGGRAPLTLPRSNVLYFELSGGASFVARPSGTEPKIKLYLLAQGETKAQAEEIIRTTRRAAEEIIRRG